MPASTPDDDGPSVRTMAVQAAAAAAVVTGAVALHGAVMVIVLRNLG